MYNPIDSQIQDSRLRANNDPSRANKNYQASKQLVDLLAAQSLITEKEKAAAMLQEQAPGAPNQTVAQQKQQQLQQLTAQDIARQMGMAPPPAPQGPQGGPPQMGQMRPPMPPAPGIGMPRTPPQPGGIAAAPQLRAPRPPQAQSGIGAMAPRMNMREGGIVPRMNMAGGGVASTPIAQFIEGMLNEGRSYEEIKQMVGNSPEGLQYLESISTTTPKVDRNSSGMLSKFIGNASDKLMNERIGFSDKIESGMNSINGFFDAGNKGLASLLQKGGDSISGYFDSVEEKNKNASPNAPAPAATPSATQPAMPAQPQSKAEQEAAQAMQAFEESGAGVDPNQGIYDRIDELNSPRFKYRDKLAMMNAGIDTGRGLGGIGQVFAAARAGEKDGLQGQLAAQEQGRKDAENQAYNRQLELIKIQAEMTPPEELLGELQRQKQELMTQASRTTRPAKRAEIDAKVRAIDEQIFELTGGKVKGTIDQMRQEEAANQLGALPPMRLTGRRLPG